jgi:hypothetical protein
MSDERFERVFRTVDRARRAMLKKLVFGATFSLPIIASFSAKEIVGGPRPAFATPTPTTTPRTITKTTTETFTETVTVSTCTTGA